MSSCEDAIESNIGKVPKLGLKLLELLFKLLCIRILSESDEALPSA